MIEIVVNGTRHSLDNVPEDMPLLWVLRDRLKLTGTKFGCGGGFCGACTVHLEGEAVRSCLLPAVAVAGKRIATIEGLSKDGRHPLQLAWIAEDVPQCGYCQSGQLMQAAAFLKDKPIVNDETITAAMSGNICRCGTYSRIRKAIKRAASGEPALAAVDMPECAAACSSYVTSGEA
ncbi:isoquinoline 1-oxidoreductase alpha subunit [Paraburkholderia sp. BL27I4N3]|uniref:(2Fe-2S)-binding protein n=1 Tax=Paraburkholderia sp. BL27I4N3 TaxID=1938805 RepID=UPI000E23602B|nr:(2Fe-2S)-binding protein [Paraburkholderia sp. BL27I4N3]REE22960.1 isoquinoline 1-oxidoreductase alpha subunit [Paraburkholderia sp. BL27I4N3]